MRSIFWVATLLAGSSAHAQVKPRTVSGVVRCGVESAPVEYVTVIAKPSGQVSGSHPDGAFYIDVKRHDTLLVFKHEGFDALELPITESNYYEVALQKTVDNREAIRTRKASVVPQTERK